MEIAKEFVNIIDEDDVEHISRKFILLPGCCEESINALRPYCRLNMGNYLNSMRQLTPDDGTPEWNIPHLNHNFMDPFIDHEIVDGMDIGYNKTFIAVKYCPYCGKRLPGFRKKANPPEPMFRDGDRHCLTCEQRVGWGCNCWPFEAAYEVDE